MTEPHRKPRAFRLDEAPTTTRDAAPVARRPRAIDEAAVIVPIPDEAANGWPDQPAAPAPAPRGGWSWASLLITALGGLVSLAVALAVDRFIRDLFERATWLGWLAAALAGLAVVALIALAAREMLALARQRTIARLQQRGADAHAHDDGESARAIVGEMIALYGARADTARGRERLAGHAGEIIDGSDLIALAERDLLAPLDARATALVMNAAKRVSVVTAVSPRALIDIAYVLGENLRLIRRLAELYGGRPGTIGFLRLTRSVLAHLAATGALALGDSLVQQLVGHGIAARLSAKLGEGVVNGLLTARIGIAAMEVCRPLPFIGLPRPGVSQFLAELVRLGAPKREAPGHQKDKPAEH
ncbi:MAG: UPF0283 membrane protein [Alphaproteobacteria bacterium]|nr:MAG: UPF0283 membrane protein [Alphaproteobacteria bacterium]